MGNSRVAFITVNAGKPKNSVMVYRHSRTRVTINYYTPSAPSRLRLSALAESPKYTITAGFSPYYFNVIIHNTLKRAIELLNEGGRYPDGMVVRVGERQWQT